MRNTSAGLKQDEPRSATIIAAVNRAERRQRHSSLLWIQARCCCRPWGAPATGPAHSLWSNMWFLNRSSAGLIPPLLWPWFALWGPSSTTSSAKTGRQMGHGLQNPLLQAARLRKKPHRPALGEIVSRNWRSSRSSLHRPWSWSRTRRSFVCSRPRTGASRWRLSKPKLKSCRGLWISARNRHQKCGSNVKMPHPLPRALLVWDPAPAHLLSRAGTSPVYHGIHPTFLKGYACLWRPLLAPHKGLRRNWQPRQVKTKKALRYFLANDPRTLGHLYPILFSGLET
mmetsp:Transcript_42374/g.75937  ORF Transcript_42374/g.75937 Transcript_42374/m.75937 type:complete len:284 (-) Transcript_42374:1499-2350(-)